MPSARSRVLGLVTVPPWIGRAGQGGAGLWSEAEGSAFGGEKGRMAEGIGYGILPRPPRSGGRGSGADRTERPELAGLVRSGCLGRSSPRPAGGLPLGGPALEPSRLLPVPHSPDQWKRPGRALIPSAPRPGRDLDGWNKASALESQSPC